MDNYNPRGHAFVTFSNGYNKMSGWSWFIQAKKQELVPSYGEYLKQALDVYDRMMVNEPLPTPERNREVVFEIHNTLTQSMNAMTRGVFRYRTTDVGRMVTPKEKHAGTSTEMNEEYRFTTRERGYDEIEGNDMVSSVVKALAHRLTEQELRVLVAYIDCEYGVTWKSVADGLGLTRRQTQRAVNRIRQEVKRSGLMEVIV